MKKNISLAVAALLSLISVQDCVNAIGIDQKAKIESNLDLDIDLEALEKIAALTEENRYVGSDGNFINLAQTEGHARLKLTKIQKYSAPQDDSFVQTENCSKDSDTTSLAEGMAVDEVTHCPIKDDGQKHIVSIKQQNLDDNAYVSEMYVGNPPQKIRALFDTGSTNTWILNKEVKLPFGASKELSFDSTASKTFQKTKQAAMIQFGSGALAGHFVTDDIRLGTCDGKKSSGQIHIQNQKFGNVEKQMTIFTGSNFEAIVGLAYPTLAEPGVKPVFDEMMNQNLLQDNLFSFYLTSKQAENMGIESDLTFGYYDKTKYKGDINWHPVEYQYMFGVKLDDIKFNGQSSKVCEGRDCLITFDSGTSLMSVPSFASNTLQKSGIPTANTPAQCSSPQQFGDMTLVIGGKDYIIPNDEWTLPLQSMSMAQGGAKQQLKLGPLGPQLMAQTGSDMHIGTEEEHTPDAVALQVEADADRKKKGQGLSTGYECSSTIMTMDLSKEMFLVGDVFMRRFYTIFDRSKNQVGLAQAITNDKIRAQTAGVGSSSQAELAQKKSAAAKK